MADETPKAPEPELSIAPEGEAKPPARPRNLYAFVKQAWKDPRSGVVKETHFQRMVEWRRGNAFVRVERPTRIDRARELGYPAKQGSDVGWEERPGPPVQRQRGREDPAEHRLPRPHRQVTSRRLDMGREPSDFLVRESDDRFEHGDAQALPVCRVERGPPGPEEHCVRS